MVTSVHYNSGGIQNRNEWLYNSGQHRLCATSCLLKTRNRCATSKKVGGASD